MLDFGFKIPMWIVVALIAWAWLSFFTTIFI